MSTIEMAKKKNLNRNPQSEAIAKAIMENYHPESVEEMQDALKDIFGPMFEAMLQVLLSMINSPKMLLVNSPVLLL